jgi:hypothetical protein
VGAGAAASNTTGSYNVGVGGSGSDNYNVLNSNTSGAQLTAVGVGTLARNTTGAYNTALGAYALNKNTTAANNTAVGYHALNANTTGTGNSAVGYGAALACTTATELTAIGSTAGDAVTTGPGNTLIGSRAGVHGVGLTTGPYNTVVGSYSNTSAVDSSHQIVLGHNVTGNADSSLCFGTGTTDSAIAFGATSITAPSDVRLKEDIQDEEIGLDFINALRPVTFLWKKEKDIPSEMKAYKEGSEERTMNGKHNHGFIAQEVKATIDSYDLKDGFDMWQEDETDGRQRVAPSALVPILVKAIQELTARITTLEG